jgi:hypothetical protein
MNEETFKQLYTVIFAAYKGGKFSDNELLRIITMLGECEKALIK